MVLPQAFGELVAYGRYNSLNDEELAVEHHQCHHEEEYEGAELSHRQLGEGLGKEHEYELDPL